MSGGGVAIRPGESGAVSRGTRVSEQRFTLDLTAAGGPRRYYR